MLVPAFRVIVATSQNPTSSVLGHVADGAPPMGITRGFTLPQEI